MAMSVDARELTLHAENNESLWNRSRHDFLKSEIKKRARGTYDREKAVKLWEYFADEAAASYVREYGATGPHGKYGIFSKGVRREAARYFRDLSAQEYDSGELRKYHPEWFPKASKKKTSKKKDSRKPRTVEDARRELRSCVRRDK